MATPPTTVTAPDAAVSTAAVPEPAITLDQEPVVTFDDVLAARERLAPHLPPTPLLRSTTLGRLSGTALWLKAEHLQRTGSFKARGALNAVLQLSPAQRARGLVTLSAGNHGQALAWAASLVGARCVVFVPATAVPTKVAAIRSHGAETRFAPSMVELFAEMEAHRAAQGLHFVAPFGDPAIVAGQGTAGLELVEQCPDVEHVVVCVGGGGLISGVALAVKELRPGVRVVGVEPEGADVVGRSLAAGRCLSMGQMTTIADGLAAPFAAPLCQRVIADNVDDLVTVTDDELVEALRLILERAKQLVEPAGAAAVAALLTGKAGVAQGAATVATLSGGNVDLGRLKGLL